jgi:hypothetical protein
LSKPRFWVSITPEKHRLLDRRRLFSTWAACPPTDIAGGLPGKKQIHNRLDEVDIIVATGYYYRNQPKDELFAKALLKPVKPIANPSNIYSWRTSRAADGGL